jgi:Ran GTPase-activating protein (RanGAP) involved in mRNA processing and transport
MDRNSSKLQPLLRVPFATAVKSEEDDDIWSCTSHRSSAAAAADAVVITAVETEEPSPRADSTRHQLSAPMLQAQISAHLELSRQYLPRLFSSDRSLTELYLANTNCGDVSVTALTDGLKNNTSLKVLDLSNNGITDEGCVMIAEAVQHNQTLTSLTLSKNCIGDRGAIRMVAALCVNSSLLMIDVSLNEAISETQVSEVTMLAHLNAHSSRLKQTLLQLRRNDIGDSLDLSRAGAQLKEFRDLVHNQREHLDDWAAEMLCKYLADNKSVTFVDLSSNHIGDVGALHIANMLRRNTKIDRLVLQHNLITSVGAQHLIAAVVESNNSLRFLSVFKNALSQEFAVKLEWVMAINRQPLQLKSILTKVETNCPMLTAVHLDDHLSERYYDDISARLISDALRKNTHVKSLAITNGKVTVVGTRFIADLLALNNTLEMLDLSNCPIVGGSAYLAPSCALSRSLKVLRLANTSMTDAAATQLANALLDNTSIHELDISGNPLVNAAGEAFVHALNKNTTVETLLLTGTSISDRVLQEITERLRLLSEPEQLRNSLPLLFTQAASLAKLDLDGRKYKRQLTDSAMRLLSEALGQNYVTQHLSLAHNQLTFSGMVYLSGALSENTATLTHLDISHNPVSNGNEFGRLLAGVLDSHTALQYVDVSGTGLDDAGARSIIAIHNKDGQLPIRELVFSENRDISPSVAFVLRVLVQMNSLLFTFKVRFRPLLSRWLSNLDLAIPFADTQLDLSNYSSGEISGSSPEIRRKCSEAARIVCEFAMLVPTVSFINFSRNGVDCDGAEHFSKLLATHPGITSLDLSSNWIADRGGILLRQGVEQAPNLLNLSLANNPAMSQSALIAVKTVITYNLQTPEIKSILVALRNHDPSLKQLDFSNRGFEKKQKSVASHRGEDGDLERTAERSSPVDPNDELLGDDQTLLIVAALQSNPFVSRLDLSNNFISLAAFEPLCELLKISQCCLRSVLVKNTNISGTRVGVLVQEVLLVNKTLVELDISYNELDDEAGKLILHGIRQNTTLTLFRATACGFSSDVAAEIENAAEMNKSSGGSGLKDLLAAKRAPATPAANSAPSAPPPPLPEKVFDGAGKGFSSGNAIEVCNAFKHSETLEILDLSSNDLSDKCGATIFQILASNHSIRQLNLSVNCFGRETLVELRNFLRTNTSVVEIDLRRNDLPLDGLVKLSESLLDDSDTIQCVHLMLSSIVTSVNPLVASQMMDFFGRTLSLNKQLKLKRLLPGLRQNDSTITEIELDGLNCNDVGAKSIGSSIAHNTNVTRISLSRGEIGDSGLTDLCYGLCMNRSCVELDVSYNDFGDVGVSALCDVLKVNNSITKINISGNTRVSQKAVDSLRHVLIVNDSLRSLKVASDPSAGGVVAARRRQQQQQKTFDLERLDFVLLLNNRHGSLKDLLRREGEFIVREVNCSNAAASSQGRIFDDQACEVLCKVLAENRFVTSVDISNNAISSAAAANLEALLLQNRSITELNVSYNHLGDGVIRLCDVLKHNHTLTRLRVEHNGASAATIERTHLHLQLNQEPLAFKMEMLRLLEQTDKDTNTLCRVSIPEIEYQEAKKQQMDDDSVIIACSILKDNLFITSVDFSWNRISDNGFSEILRMLRRNTGISSVSLAHNFLCDDAIHDLHANIRHLPHFTSLDLSHNAVTGEMFTYIVQILSLNPHLHEIKLVGNRIPPVKIAVIDFFAAANKNAPDAMRSILIRSYENAASLTEVMCDGFYSIGLWMKEEATTMKLLAFALQANTTVKSISLEFNDIEDSSIAYLAGFLSVNNTVSNLSLANNLLQDVTQLIRAIRNNTALRTINLRSNKLNLASAQAIKHFLLNNKTVVELDVSNNAWGNIGASTIVGALSMNSSLRIINVEGPGVLPATVENAELGLSLCYLSQA